MEVLDSKAMAGQPFKKNASYQDLYTIPEGWTGQIIDGDLWAFARPAPPHSLAITRLSQELRPAQDDKATGWIILFEVEIWFGKHLLVPDLAGWRRPRAPDLEVQTLELAPDWVCEGLSPATARLDRGRKREIYAEHGVGHLWFADPTHHTVEVLALQGSHYQVVQSAGSERARLAPFDVELDLTQLWTL